MRRTPHLAAAYLSVILICSSVAVTVSAPAAHATVAPVLLAGSLGTPTKISQLTDPGAVVTAVGADGTIFYGGYSGQITKVATNGDISAYAGTGVMGFSGDGGSAIAAQIGSVYAMALDADGNLYFADVYTPFAESQVRIRRVSSTGTITTVAGSGAVPATAGEGDGGPATQAALNFVPALAVDGSTLYFSEYSGHIRKFTLGGNISTIASGAGTGTACSGAGGAASGLVFFGANALAIDGAHNLIAGLVCEGANNSLLMRISADGSSTTLLAGGANSLGLIASIIVEASDFRFVAGGRLWHLSGATLTAESSTPGICTPPGTGLLLINSCIDTMREDPTGGYVVTYLGSLFHVTDGVITRLSANPAGLTDGAPAAGVPLGNGVISLVSDASGQLFFSAASGSLIVRSLSPAGIAGTKAGTGLFGATTGFDGFGGPAVNSSVPYLSYIDAAPDGSLYISGAGQIGRVALNGTLHHVAGNGDLGDGPDGGAATATAIDPLGVAVVGTTLYVAAYSYGTCGTAPSTYACADGGVIRKIDAAGKISTVYRKHGSGGYIGKVVAAPDGTLVFVQGGTKLARLNPSTGELRQVAVVPGAGDIAIDSAGSIFVSTFTKIIKVTSYGQTSQQATFLNHGAMLPAPTNVATDHHGNVFLANSYDIWKYPGMAAAWPGPAPTVTGITAAGRVGAVVTITGTNLAGVATVKFGGIASKSLTVLSPTTITAAVPAGAKTGKISLSTAGGTATSKSTFTVIAAPTQLAAGASHSCARLSNGATACWGANASGQLGNGSTTASSTPLPVPGLAGVTQVAAGGAFSCARLSSGGVKCWGSNTKGQLGRGTLTGSKTPVAVLSTSGALGSAASVATGDAFACAVVAPGPSGTVKCWGQNSSGQLGDGTTTQRTKAVTVLSAKGTPLKGATAIAAGGSTACARLTTGAVRCWGANAHGQLGRGNVAKSSFAVAVTGIDGSAARATALTVGGSHACAVLTTGGVRCWGANSSGQLGDGTTTQRTSPVAARTSRTAALAGVRSISAGGAHTCAITGSGGAARVRCWGSDASGQIGTTATGNAKYATLTSGTVANGATAIAAGGSHTIALSSSTSMPVKALSGWGKNLNGQLGIGTTTSEPTPTRSPTL